MATAKKLATSASIAKNIEIATENLFAAKNNGDASVKTLDKERKKLLAENKRISKKTAVLSKKKKAAATRLKKCPSAANRKAVNVITKELAALKKIGVSTRAASSANSEELKAIKASVKQAAAYLTVIVKADKLLNKPKKKRAKKRVVKAVARLTAVAA